VLVCAPGGNVLIERFSAGRNTPRQRERGEEVAELRGAALDEGRIEVSGDLPAGTAVFARGVGERFEEHEAAFLLDDVVDGSALLRITVTTRGNPELVVVRGKRETNIRPEVDARVS
jgi:hypothetical protein